MHLQHLFSFSVDVVAEKAFYQVLDDGVSKPWVELFANIHVYGNGSFCLVLVLRERVRIITDFYVFGHDARRQEGCLRSCQRLLNLNSQVKMSPGRLILSTLC